MQELNFEAVIKIGSMAMIQKKEKNIDYNVIANLARSLKPGYILVSSGAVEIGRVDFLNRNGRELCGDGEEIKTDYSAQGQAMLMNLYRQFIDPQYSVRQVLIEHGHFNDPEKAAHLKALFYRAANQNAIPIVNYNDSISSEENRRFEIAALKKEGEHTVVECVDNDETAAVVAGLVGAKKLILLTSTDGIYKDVNDPSTLIEEVTAPTMEELLAKIDEITAYCHGASRAGANGAKAKLIFAKKAVEQGTTVMIANAKYNLDDILAGKVRCTIMRLQAEA